MSTPVTDVDRVVRSRRIQIRTRELTAVGRFRVIEVKADSPLSWRRLDGALANGLLNIGNGPEIAIDLLEMAYAGVANMCVRVDKPRQYCPSREVDFASTSRCE